MIGLNCGKHLGALSGLLLFNLVAVTAVVRVGVETGFSGFVFCFSTALGVGGYFDQGIAYTTNGR